MESKRVTRSFLGPAAVLLILLTAADLWAEHHLGLGIRDPGVLTGVLAAVAAAWGIVGWFFTKDEVETARTTVRGVLKGVIFSWTLVLILSVGFVFAVLLWSSVTVVAEPGADATDVRLTAIDDTLPGHAPAAARSERLDRNRPQVRFGARASPLAGAYLVRADGYLPAVVEAVPLFGARVQLGRDALRSPAVLVRPDGRLWEALVARGYLSVAQLSGGREAELARSSTPGVSLLLGRRPPALRDRVPDWERELVAAGVSDARLRSSWITGWLRVERLPFEGDVRPGDTLVVRVVARSGRELAHERIVLAAADEDLFLQPRPREDQP